MGTTFFETMSGELRDDAGVAHHVAFDVRATSRRPLWRLSEGRQALSGTIRAAPWVDGVACAGTLEVAPLRRRLVYELSFVGEDGGTYALFGQKDLHPLRPWASMTELATTLSRGGQPLARGTLRFDANDLPAFLASFSSLTALGSVDLGGPAPIAPPPPLTPAELDALRGFTAAIIAPGRITPAPDQATIDGVVRRLPHLPPHVVALGRAGLRGLDGLARARTGRGLSALHPDEAERLLTLIERLGGGAVLHTLSLPVKTAHWCRADYLAALGLVDAPAPRPEAPPKWMVRHHPPEDIGPDEELEVDVAVVGTGAGGGAIAAALAEAGLAVVMIEEGRYHGRPDIAGPADARLLRFWRDAGMQIGLGASPISIPTGRLVGGSTAINSGTCFRTPDPVLVEWRLAGLPADFHPARFAPWLDRVESVLQVAPAGPEHLGAIAAIIARGAEAVGAAHGPLRRNAPGCDGQGVCVYGCPTDAKRSSNVSWVPRALAAGAELYTGLSVRQALMRGRRCVGLVATGQDGAPRRLTVRARAVVVACGALESPLLLARSGVRLPWLGRNLSCHPALGVFGRFEQDLDEPWRAIPQAYGFHGIVDPRVRFEGFYAPPGLAMGGLALRGAALTRWMDDWRRVGAFGFMVKDPGTGRVRPGPGGRPLLTWTMTPDVRDLLQRGYAALAEVLLRGGAVEVLSAVDGVPSVTTVEAARAIATQRLRPADFHLMGFHPLGTCRMAGSVEQGVVDGDHQVFGTEGLYVVDGASVPTSLGVNPQLTIMAMALRAGDRLAARLG